MTSTSYNGASPKLAAVCRVVHIYACCGRQMGDSGNSKVMASRRRHRDVGTDGDDTAEDAK